MDARHAALVEQVVARLAPLGWEVTVEYTFSRFGDKGAVDVIGWRAQERALLLVEVKSELDNLQNMLSVLDRKTRLVPALLALERDWRAAVVGAILVMPDRSTFRDGIARFRATFAAALPSRNVEIRRWLAQPGPGPLRGTWFLRLSGPSILVEGRGGPRRIRASRGSATAPNPGPTKREPRAERVAGPENPASDGRSSAPSAATSRGVSP